MNPWDDYYEEDVDIDELREEDEEIEAIKYEMRRQYEADLRLDMQYGK